MNKNVKAILICTACLLIVSFMYIGGLISDAKHTDGNKEREQLKVQSTENSSNTNILFKDMESTPVLEDFSLTNVSSIIDNESAHTQTKSPTPRKQLENNQYVNEDTNVSITPNTKQTKNAKESTTDNQSSVSSKIINSNDAVNEMPVDPEVNTPQVGSLKSSKLTSAGENIVVDDKNNSESTNEDQPTEVTAPPPTELEEDLQEQTELIPPAEQAVEEDLKNTEEIEKEVKEEEPEKKEEPEVVKENEEPEKKEEPEVPLTTLEQAKKLAEIGNLDSFLELTEMVENSENTLEQRKLIQIAGSMSDTLPPEVLFEILKVSSSEDMLKMAVVTLSEANNSSVIEMAATKYALTTDSVERDYLLDVIVKSNDPTIVASLSDIASANSYDTPISQAAINTMAIIGSKESTIDLLNRIDNTTSADNIEIITKSFSKIHTEDALPILLGNISDITTDISKSIAIVKALGNYPAKDVSKTLEQLYNQPNLNSSLRYEIDKTYEKITK